VALSHPAQEAWEVSARFFLSRGDPVFHRQSITLRLMKIEAISAIHEFPQELHGIFTFARRAQAIPL
jgi:hypothetical protein